MYKNLTPQERLERIAQIINKGIYLLALKEGWFDNSPVKKKTEGKTVLSQRQSLIMTHLKSRCRITNKEVCELLGVSRDTAHRELKCLLRAGLLEARGRGRAVAYFEK